MFVTLNLWNHGVNVITGSEEQKEAVDSIMRWTIPASIATLAQRWPNVNPYVGPTSAHQRWANVDLSIGPTLAQRSRANVGPTLCQHRPNVGPLTLAQRYANGCMPTLYQHWPNGGCVTGLFVRGPHRSPMVSPHKGPGTLALMFA